MNPETNAARAEGGPIGETHESARDRAGDDSEGRAGWCEAGGETTLSVGPGAVSVTGPPSVVNVLLSVKVTAKIAPAVKVDPPVLVKLPVNVPPD
jgi:hypothetical protein